MRTPITVLLVLVSAAWAAPRPQAVEVSADTQQGTVVLKPPELEDVTQVTSANQYQKLYPHNGKYKFGYDDDKQFRVEEREGNGHLKGIFGYVDDDGNIHAWKYSYNGYGYRQEPYTIESLEELEDLRLAPEAQGPPRVIDQEQLVFDN